MFVNGFQRLSGAVLRHSATTQTSARFGGLMRQAPQQLRAKSTAGASHTGFNGAKQWKASTIRTGWGIVGFASAGFALNWCFVTAPDHLWTLPNFFDNRFITKSNNTANEIADFYGTEDFMQIFCVFPFMEKAMMRGSYFDDDGVVHTWGMPLGTMLVSMEFDDREEEIVGPDGQPDTVVAHFNKREVFKNVMYNPFTGRPATLWEMVLNFGYNRREDGTCEVYHKGESFYGPFPIRWLFWAHAQYVIWATEKHINSPTFVDSDKIEEKEQQRRNIPLHVFNGFLDQLAADVEQEMTRLKAAGLTVSKHEATLAKLRQHRSGMDMVRRQSLDEGLPEEVVAAVNIQKTKAHRMKSSASGSMGRQTETTISLVVEDQEVQDTIKSALNLSKQEGQGDGDALEQLLAPAGDRWLDGAPIGSPDRELARRIAQRNAVVYDVAGEAQMAKPHSANVSLKSHPSAVGGPAIEAAAQAAAAAQAKRAWYKFW